MIMTTECPECKKTFKLYFSTVYIGTEIHPPNNDVAVVKCPHCNHREEM